MTAFIAFIPMRLFDDATVSNDALAHLVVSALLLAYLSRRLRWHP